MGYFSEMSLDMQEGRKPSAASLTRECAFEDGESFDELPVPPADRQPAPPAAEPAPQSAFEDDGDLDEAPDELEQSDEAEPPAEETGEGNNADESQAEPAKADTSNVDADEEKRRAEHEAAEAKRKAEWEAKQCLHAAGQRRCGKADPAQYEGVRVGVYPDQVPGRSGICPPYHAPEENDGPLLPVHQQESMGVHSG